MKRLCKAGFKHCDHFSPPSFTEQQPFANEFCKSDIQMYM